MRSSVCILLLSSALASCARSTTIGPSNGATVAEITAADLRRRLFIIADDSMMGRDPGGAGNYKTAEYVAAEFRRLGLQPAGDNGTYFQAVPFMRARPSGSSHIEVGGASLAVGRDFVPI